MTAKLLACICLATVFMPLAFADRMDRMDRMDPDVGRDMVEIVTARGYPIEEFFAQTTDGYILGLFRIPHGKSPSQHSGPHPVVLLQHGLLDSSFTWVNNFANQSLAYLLADAGFDVWMGNNRGNTWSRRHAWLNPTSAEFWDFTWDQMAQYDLPTMVSFILNATGVETLSYVGHSEGTMQAFAGFSINPTLSKQVNLFVALAPVAYDGHMTSLLIELLIDLHADEIFALFGVHEFLPGTTILQQLAPDICEWVPWGCADVLFLIAGPGTSFNDSRIEVYVSQTPAGSSTKNIVHFAQGARSDKFQMYDYGCNALSCPNMDHYGQKTPPNYYLSNVTVPTALFWAENDDLADPTDVKRLMAELPPKTVVHSNYQTIYNHMDFTWAYNANTVIYPDVIKQLKAYAPVPV